MTGRCLHRSDSVTISSFVSVWGRAELGMWSKCILEGIASCLCVVLSHKDDFPFPVDGLLISATKHS